jgi:hypothetical protein
MTESRSDKFVLVAITFTPETNVSANIAASGCPGMN